MKATDSGLNPQTKATGGQGWFPHPVLSALLGSTWLALSHSLALVHWLSALLIAWLVPKLLNPFLGAASGVQWAPVPRLVGVVFWDIVMSNITVARIALGSMDQPQPAWLRVPLASSHHRVNALFASIITTTPGTVSMTIDEQRGEILVHALNCDDPQGMIHDMKVRYEQPLLAIFRVDEQPSAAVAKGGA